MAGDGQYALQPVYVDDLAALVEQAVFRTDSYVIDAVGQEVYSFRGVRRADRLSIGAKRPLIPVGAGNLKVAARALGAVLGDTLLTDQELEGLMANLLVSSEPGRCPTRLSTWLARTLTNWAEPTLPS